MRLGWLEQGTVHWRVVGSIPSQGVYEKATIQCLSLSFSLKAIKKKMSSCDGGCNSAEMMPGCPLFSFNATRKIIFSPVKFLYSSLPNNEHQTKKSLFSCIERSSPRATVSSSMAACRKLMPVDQLNVPKGKLPTTWVCPTDVEFWASPARGLGGQAHAPQQGGRVARGRGVSGGGRGCIPFHTHVWQNLGL